MPRLTGGMQPVDLGRGISLRTPGVLGSADRSGPRSVGTRGPEDATGALDEAFALAHVSELETVAISGAHAAAQPGGETLRGSAAAAELELEVPDLGPTVGQIVLLIDETGALSWHLPTSLAGSASAPSMRGAQAKTSFVIPFRPPPPGPVGSGGDRSLVRAVGSKLLKVLVYPVTDPLFGLVGPGLARAWEAKRRPYGLRRFEPENYHSADGPPLGPEDWDRLSAGPALLFVHGTFSTAHGAFAGLPAGVMRELHTRYGGRVFAFNHHTLSDDPADNVRWLVGNAPAARGLELDIVCHSRGGLLSRVLAERPAAFRIPDHQFRVNRIVHVGVPNQGTLLANPDHMVHMLDRITTAINLAFSGPVAETVDAILTVIKIIAHGGLNSLHGLAAMHPAGSFLKELNTTAEGNSQYFAVAADYEPVNLALKQLVLAVGNMVQDRIFQSAANDLVVPEEGVYATNGSSRFPIPSPRVLRIPGAQGVTHVDMFKHETVAQALLTWL